MDLRDFVYPLYFNHSLLVLLFFVFTFELFVVVIVLYVYLNSSALALALFLMYSLFLNDVLLCVFCFWKGNVTTLFLK